MAAADVHYSAASELLTDGPRLSFSPIHTVPATVVQVLAVVRPATFVRAREWQRPAQHVRPPIRTQCIYCVLVFVLPGVDPFFGTVSGAETSAAVAAAARRAATDPEPTPEPCPSQSNHLTVLHAGCWLVVSAVGFWVQRESTRILKTGYLKMYRRTHQLSIAPVVVCTVGESARSRGRGPAARDVRAPHGALVSMPDLPAVNFLLLTLLGLDTWVEQETGDDPISKRVLQVASAVEAAVTLGLGSRYICERRGGPRAGTPAGPLGPLGAACPPSPRPPPAARATPRAAQTRPRRPMPSRCCVLAPAVLVVRFNRERPPSETQLLTRQHARRMSLDEHGAAAAGYGAARSIPSLGDGSVDLGMDGSSRSDGARAQQLVAILMQQIEVLTADTDRLNNEVTAAHTGKGSTHKRLTDLDAECSRLREQARQELLRYTRAQDEIGALREELRRTGTELRSAREALQQEKRRSEKLSLTLNIERVATRKAQAAIDGMMYASATEAETTLGNTMAAILGTGAGSRPGPSPLRETGRRPTHPSLNGDGDDDDDDSDYGILGDDPAGSAPDGSAATEGLVRQMMERAARSGDRPATGGGAGAGGTDDA